MRLFGPRKIWRDKETGYKERRLHCLFPVGCINVIS